MKLEINNKRKFGNFTKMWKLSNTQLNNQSWCHHFFTKVVIIKKTRPLKQKFKTYSQND